MSAPEFEIGKWYERTYVNRVSDYTERISGRCTGFGPGMVHIGKLQIPLGKGSWSEIQPEPEPLKDGVYQLRNWLRIRRDGRWYYPVGSDGDRARLEPTGGDDAGYGGYTFVGPEVSS